jgi:hypothetical protein
MTTTLERPQTGNQVIVLEKQNRLLKLTAIVLAVVAIAAGIWGINQATATDDSLAVPDAVDALIDDWWNALEQGDNSVLDLYLTRGYHLYGDMRFSGEDLVSHLAGNADYTSEWITPTFVASNEGDGTYVVVRGIRNTHTPSEVGYASALAFEIETVDDGTLKIAHTAFIYRRV